MCNKTDPWNSLEEERNFQILDEKFCEKLDSLIEQCNMSTINLLQQIEALKDSSRTQDQIAKIAIIISSTKSLNKILDDYQKREIEPYLRPPHEREAIQEEKIRTRTKLKDNRQFEIQF